MESPKILVIIPAHNEAESLAGVIEDVRSNQAADIVVVDDGSTDETAAIALESGAKLLRLPFNLGIGSTIQTGLLFAFRGGYDAAVQVDGDGQHDASFLPSLLEPILNGEVDMVVGSRYLSGNSYDGTAARKMGTAIFSKVLSLMLRQRLTDATSGFRALNRDVIDLFAHDYPRDYPEVEALLLAHNARCRVKEIQVTMRSRSGGSSSINLFRSVYYMAKVFLALAVGASKRRTPEAR